MYRARLHKIKDRWVVRKWRQKRVTVSREERDRAQGQDGTGSLSQRGSVGWRWACGWVRALGVPGQLLP